MDRTGEVYHAGFEASKKIAQEIVNNATKGVALTVRMTLIAIQSIGITSLGKRNYLPEQSQFSLSFQKNKI